MIENSQTQTEEDSNSIQIKESGAKQVKANQTQISKAPTSFSYPLSPKPNNTRERRSFKSN